MPIHPLFLSSIADQPGYRDAVVQYAAHGDQSLLNTLYATVTSSDELLTAPVTSASPTYRTVFVRAGAPKIIPAIIQAVKTGTVPFFELTFLELDQVRKTLGMNSFGSPQDVLYTFTSERAPDWGGTLKHFHFSCACMAGVGRMIVTIAPRYLDISKPDFETKELQGAISRDFWESLAIVGRQPPAISFVEWVLSNALEADGFDHKVSGWSKSEIQRFFSLASKHPNGKAVCLAGVVAKTVGPLEGEDLESRWQKAVKSKTKSTKASSQEQIALKYIEEGRFLQKILGGTMVDHLQSNVKMQTNPLRGNKVEVDSIYRAIGKKQLIIVEAKDGTLVSRTQLYASYEAYRLRLPQSWDVTVIAALLSDETIEDIPYQIIDLIEVGFDDQLLGNIPESLFSMTTKKHYRWKVLRDPSIAG